MDTHYVWDGKKKTYLVWDAEEQYQRPEDAVEIDADDYEDAAQQFVAELWNDDPVAYDNFDKVIVRVQPESGGVTKEIRVEIWLRDPDFHVVQVDDLDPEEDF